MHLISLGETELRVRRTSSEASKQTEDIEAQRMGCLLSDGLPSMLDGIGNFMFSMNEVNEFSVECFRG